MIVFERRFVRLAEERWGPPPGKGFGRADYPGLDVVSFLHLPEPAPGAFATRTTRTLFIDMALEEAALFARCHATTRKGISRAGREDRLQALHWREPTDAQIAEFCDFFGRFAAERGIELARAERLRRYARAGILDLSVMRAPDGQALTWHSHVVERGRVRQLHFASSQASADKEFRYLVGRSNRFHHWQDILRFKREGCVHYDFGGLYTGSTDAKGLHINEFKLSFGGDPGVTYNCDVALTLRGLAYLAVRRARARLRPGRGLG